MQPADVIEYEEGYRGRRNNDLRVVGTAVAYILSMIHKTNPNDVTRSLPGFDAKLDVEDRMNASAEREADFEEV